MRATGGLLSKIAIRKCLKLANVVKLGRCMHVLSVCVFMTGFQTVRSAHRHGNVAGCSTVCIARRQANKYFFYLGYILSALGLLEHLAGINHSCFS